MPLTFHVDYWDRLGWKDPYASPLFTARQRAYARALHTDGVYTPQVVVQGAVHMSGNRRPAVHAAVESARASPAPVHIVVDRAALRGANVTVVARSSGAIARADLYVALVELEITTRVARGENAGETLREHQVVRALVGPLRVDAAGAVTADLPIPAGAGPCRIVVFAQDRASLKILGVRASPPL